MLTLTFALKMITLDNNNAEAIYFNVKKVTSGVPTTHICRFAILGQIRLNSFNFQKFYADYGNILILYNRTNLKWRPQKIPY